MRTRLMILTIVLGIAAAAIGVAVALIILTGLWVGIGISASAASLIVLTYLLVVGPWQRRWGATSEEVRRTMPGDHLVPGASSTTRAITVNAPPGDVWPWVAQIGFEKAGWYSYDWIDNDGRPSADRVIKEFQDLRFGDRILMAPGMGPVVRELAPGQYFVAGDDEGGTWCLALYPAPEGTSRLVSRWRQRWPMTPATAFWILIADPGAFIMERRMLKGIKERVERTAGRRPEPRSSPDRTIRSEKVA